eukprot:TRINITY_DN11618_c0_g1_i2.p1 TRINITY_DN11618_c0_g1~~TRINITY_DN11618_c0_g1_i2.p1  ORF type:complete len:337 (+),score=85.66 TRINITY_DN11618_c0_g1_i2:206-1216(+)
MNTKKQQLVVSNQQQEAYSEPWTPSDGEMGLLEVLHNTRSSGEKIPVCSRPLHELTTNFSNFENQVMTLANPILLKGKMGAMQEQLGSVHDGAVISGAQFKGIAGGMQTFMENEYILVAYKDYSTWALKHHPEGVSGGWLNPWGGKKYVKKHFAIEMGSAPGVFIEITEKQFLVGCNKLHRKRVDSGMGNRPNLGGFDVLNQEQFNAIYNPSEVDAEVNKRTQHGGHHGGPYHQGPPPPSSGNSILDTIISYTPLGYYRRVRDETYKAIGNAVVTIAVTSVSVYVFYRYFIRPFIPSSEPQRSSYRSARRQVQQQSFDPGFMGYRLGDMFDRIIGT